MTGLHPEFGLRGGGEIVDDTMESFLFFPSAFSAPPREVRCFFSTFIAIGV